jgi:hypothetical protein
VGRDRRHRLSAGTASIGAATSRTPPTSGWRITGAAPWTPDHSPARPIRRWAAHHRCGSGLVWVGGRRGRPAFAPSGPRSCPAAQAEFTGAGTASIAGGTLKTRDRRSTMDARSFSGAADPAAGSPSAVRHWPRLAVGARRVRPEFAPSGPASRPGAPRGSYETRSALTPHAARSIAKLERSREVSCWRQSPGARRSPRPRRARRSRSPRPRDRTPTARCGRGRA